MYLTPQAIEIRTEFRELSYTPIIYGFLGLRPQGSRFDEIYYYFSIIFALGGFLLVTPI